MKPKFGQLWLWQTLPPMMFTYTDNGWMYLYADITQIISLMETTERAGDRVWKRKTKPHGARRYV